MTLYEMRTYTYKETYMVYVQLSVSIQSFDATVTLKQSQGPQNYHEQVKFKQLAARFNVDDICL